MKKQETNVLDFVFAGCCVSAQDPEAVQGKLEQRSEQTGPQVAEQAEQGAVGGVSTSLLPPANKPRCVPVAMDVNKSTKACQSN